eukprot:CAMPEP_0206235894 /NCGR_PEP_ID=MMETSP0047_2-20121206/13410_1 /ASSEMBLY_ACC=CAM_ASM_000192 /TAXON_ID=195065 /ORGANISM="Chroomonas mesostigmatica_cf, Strain CCMP1168" /LENGTH=117 /DNA_ID=CAMNT_0053660163 /DNA_START=42 /DNA_END=395 /DNA_ORIENTATION=-
MAEISTDTLACTYACLLLHDEGLTIDAGSIMKVIKSAGLEVESFWPGMFAKALRTSDINDLMMKGATAAAPAAAAGGAAPAAGGDAPAAGKGGDAKAAKKKEPEPEEDEDMGFSLFD